MRGSDRPGSASGARARMSAFLGATVGDPIWNAERSNNR